MLIPQMLVKLLMVNHIKIKLSYKFSQLIIDRYGKSFAQV